MSIYVRSVRIIGEHPEMRDLILPRLNEERETIDWESMPVVSLSSAAKTALSWAYVIWSDSLPPKEWRTFFESFGEAEDSLQEAMLRALAMRFGFTHFFAEKVKEGLPPESERRREAMLMIPDHENLEWTDFHVQKAMKTNGWVDNGALSGGQRTLLSWIYAIWMDESPPESWRDPFDGFGVLDEDVRALVLKAFAYRHGFSKLEVRRKKSDAELRIEALVKQRQGDKE